MDQNLASKFTHKGATFVCKGLPRGSEFGIDMKYFKTVDNFLGVKMIPPGVHFVYYSIENDQGDQSARIGFLHYFKDGEIVMKKWDSEAEEFINESNDEEISKFRANLKAVEKLLGAYPFDIWDRWKNLVGKVTENLLAKILPLCGKIYSILECKAIADYKKERNEKLDSAPLKRPNVKLFVCDEKNDDTLPHLEAAEETQLRFCRIPEKCFPDNSTPSEITKHNLDSTYLLEQLLSQHDSQNDFIGEIQVSFICFLVGHNFEAFDHWKKLIGIMCSCDDAISKYPEMFSDFITVLNYQLQEVQEDFLVDIVAGNNFVYKSLRIFFRNLQSCSVNGRLKAKCKRFQEFLTEKLLWDFSGIEEDDEDDLPVLVESKSEFY